MSNNFAPGYVALYPMLSEIAREHGYVLAIHGSVSRDFDLLAAPWTENALPPEKFCDIFIDAIQIRTEWWPWKMTVSGIDGPEDKPHGRKSWSLQLGNGAYIDLSILPTQDRHDIELNSDAFIDIGINKDD